MKFEIVTLFPEMFKGPFDESIIKRAIDKKIIEIELHNLRNWAIDKYGSVDDKPFGGGVGMLIRPDVVYNALEFINKKNSDSSTSLGMTQNTSLGMTKKKKTDDTRTIMMSARGKRFTQKKAEQLVKFKQLIILCGHYEGFDQRVSDYMIDEEISIGDYVLTGGELPAMVLVDSVARLIPRVLGKDESSKQESFSEIEIDGRKKRTKEFPQYTRPREFMEHGVPEELLSGDPKKIKAWQLKQIRDKR